MKQAEGLGWLVKFVRSQRGQYGRIYVRFAEPISLRTAIEDQVTDEDTETSGDDLQLQKLAFEVSTRINSVTPITGSALVCLVLLATRGRALSARELHLSLDRLLGQVHDRNLPLAASAKRLETVEGVQGTVGALATNGTRSTTRATSRSTWSAVTATSPPRSTATPSCTSSSEGQWPNWRWCTPPRAGPRTASRSSGRRPTAFAISSSSTSSSSSVTPSAPRLLEELRARLPGWDEQLAGGVEPFVLLDKMQPLHAFAALRPFVEAYLIVAWALLAEPVDEAVDRKVFLKRCLGLGGQVARPERVRSPEAVSKHLFEAAFRLADHRGLLVPSPDLLARRTQFAAELTDVARRIDIVEQRTYDASGRSLT